MIAQKLPRFILLKLELIRRLSSMFDTFVFCEIVLHKVAITFTLKLHLQSK